MNSSTLLESLADDFATVLPEVDAEAEHSRWQPGLGPSKKSGNSSYSKRQQRNTLRTHSRQRNRIKTEANDVISLLDLEPFRSQ